MRNAESLSETYVYGVVRAGGSAPTELEYDDAPDLHVVWDGDIGAVVRPAGSGLRAPDKRALTSHARVLQETMSWATVLPMRFGVLMPSDEVVREELLRARRDELVRLFDAFEGRVEISLRAVYEEDVVLREIVDENPRIARLRDAVRRVPGDAGFYDRVRLGEMIVAAMRAKRDGDARGILARLNPHAVDVSVDETFVERVVLRAAFLVDERRLAAFDEAVDELSRDLAARMRFKYVGPLPPHSFVDLATEAPERSTE